MSGFGEKGHRFLLTALLAILAACGGGSSGGENSSSPDVPTDLIVQSAIPENGREITPDMAEVDSLIRLKFSDRVATDSVLDPTNARNGLASSLNILDSSFLSVSGAPQLEENNFAFRPSGGVLPNGQYTVTVTSDVRGTTGQQLNRGAYDFRTSFTVGPDIYKPVIRTTFPIDGQKEVPRDSQIVIIFNESVEPATVTPQSVLVTVSGTNPVQVVAGSLDMARDGFEVIFTPDPQVAMPPNATIVVTVTGGASGVSDMVGNTLEGPPEDPDQYIFNFETVTADPPPNTPPPIDPDPMTPPDGTIYYGDQTSVGAVAETSFVMNWYNTRNIDLTHWGEGNPIPYSRRKIGKPGEILVDPRLHSTTYQSCLYVIDTTKRDVVVMSTDTMEVICRWKAFADPRGLAISPDGKTLYVTDYASNTLSALDISKITPWATRADEVMKHLADPGVRVDFDVGRGPIGCAVFPDRTYIMVCNSLDGSITELNTASGKTVATLNVGGTPTDVAVTNLVYVGITPIGWFAWITCPDGGDGSGAVAMWWHSVLSGPGGRTPSGIGSIQATLTGFNRPTSVQYDYGTTGDGLRSAFVTNSGGNTISKVSINISGGGFTLTFLPSVTQTIKVGMNPTSVCLDPCMMIRPIRQPPILCVAVRGTGNIVFTDSAQVSRPQYFLKVPGVSRVASYWNQ
ncbi:MAG: Ig-like domain-containing protein [Planctomycetota bacterium]